MKVANYLDVPPRMRDLWEWVNALCAFDYGDPTPLSDLVRDKRAIPHEFAGAIADVISGKRKPNRRAGAKAKIPPAERMKIAGSISLAIWLVDAFKSRSIDPLDRSLHGAAEIAARQGKEPISIVRELEEEARLIVAQSAREIGVTPEAIEDLLREMRNRIKRWPEV